MRINQAHEIFKGEVVVTPGMLGGGPSLPFARMDQNGVVFDRDVPVSCSDFLHIPGLLVFNPKQHEFLATWALADTVGLPTSSDIFGQRIKAVPSGGICARLN